MSIFKGLGGDYVPTLTNTANVTASSINANFLYFIFGNIVFVSGWVNINPTGAGLARLDFSLPVVGAALASGDGNGNATAPVAGNLPGSVIGNGQTGQIVIQAPGAGNVAWRFVFMYILR